MHLRFPAAPRRGLNLFRLAACLLAAGCQQATGGAPEIVLDWSVAPTPAVAGPTTVSLTLTDKAAGRPVRGAALRIQGLMTHPGMQPVLGKAQEVAPGRYAAPIELTMAGDWVFLVDAKLRDGRALHRQVELRGVRPRQEG
jgi:hypothetical protein